MNHYHIRFDPQLEIDLYEFMERWNQDAKASNIAKVDWPKATTRNVDWMPTVIATLSGVAVGVATNAIYDLIKGLINPLIKPLASGETLEIKETVGENGETVFLVVITQKVKK